MKKYQIIYADPPWEVNFQSPLGQGRKYQYSTMKLADIKKLPIRELADTNCGLFLWTTHTYLQEALNLMKIWGFKFHILITWDKGSGLTVCGFHRRTELCLYGYRGNMNLKNHKEGQAISSMFKATSSLTLIPVQYRTSRIALSLAPSQVFTGGVSRSFLTSSYSKNFGSFFSCFGVLITATGLEVIIFLLFRNL